MEELIRILLDLNSSDAEMDDAAMGLGSFTDNRAEEVLLEVSNNPDYDEMIRASCGESLAEIWLKRSQIDFSKVECLTGVALVEALSLIRFKRPDWYERLKKSNPDKLME